VALVGAVRVDLEREPDVGDGIGAEGLSEDAEDGVRLIAERERGADDVRVAAELALPETTLPPLGESSWGVKVRPSMMGAPKRRK
jgi:hypothetical protein